MASITATQIAQTDRLVVALEALNGTVAALDATAGDLLPALQAILAEMVVIHQDLQTLNSYFPNILAQVVAILNALTGVATTAASLQGLMGAGLPAALSSGGMKVKLI